MKNRSELNELLFNSETDPIPGLRRDLDIIPLQENGSSYLYFHDALGYATPNFALDDRARPILSLLDGRRSIEGFKPFLGEGVSQQQLLDYIRFLDENRLLDSPYFKKYSNCIEERYENSEVHTSNTAGMSYPSDPREVREYLDQAFTGLPSQESYTGTVRGLYAPHIDPRVGLDSYVRAFAPLRELTPSRVVLLATSHYAGLYPDTYKNRPFIITEKDFELPLATIRSDREGIDKLLAQGEDIGLTDRDRAHRIEHSVELHLLFLSYLWEHDYKIIPILVQGFEELYYMDGSHLSSQIEGLSSVLNTAYGTDSDTLFLISGDLAHVGRKFGDDRPARQMFEEVRSFDRQFLEHATEGNDEGMLKLMKQDYDPYRICGFPPLYTFLKTMPQLEGHQVGYDLWDESERESAVSFGSILYTG